MPVIVVIDQLKIRYTILVPLSLVSLDNILFVYDIVSASTQLLSETFHSSTAFRFLCRLKLVYVHDKENSETTCQKVHDDVEHFSYGSQSLAETHRIQGKLTTCPICFDLDD